MILRSSLQNDGWDKRETSPACPRDVDRRWATLKVGRDQPCGHDEITKTRPGTSVVSFQFPVLRIATEGLQRREKLPQALQSAVQFRHRGCVGNANMVAGSETL